jgi:hypothetical protein
MNPLSVIITAEEELLHRNILVLKAPFVDVRKATTRTRISNWEIYSTNEERCGKFAAASRKSNEEV